MNMNLSDKKLINAKLPPQIYLTHIAARSSPLVKDSQQKVDIEPEKTQNPPFFG